MGILFANDLHEAFAEFPRAYIPYGGATEGELRAIAHSVGDGDDTAFYNAWMQAGDRLASEGGKALQAGGVHTGRALLLRAACYYAAAYHPLYGFPVDPRLVAAYRKQIAAFDRALALGSPAILPLRIPFEGTTLPGYFIPSERSPKTRAPLVIFTNGYDATVTDLYFASAVAASRRGYHSLIFDGPGQGEMLYEQAMALRPDWETVVAAVVDFALTLDGVDAARIALSGWSLGGYLALRGASGEKRLAACIADPGLSDVAANIRFAALNLGASEAATKSLSTVDPSVLEAMSQMVLSDSGLKWKIFQRGFWVNGVSDLRAYLASAEQYTLDGRTERIGCPTLLTAADGDVLSSGVEAFYERLQCPKTLLWFKSAEGAGDHCEMLNRPLLNDRVLDWLDATLVQKG